MDTNRNKSEKSQGGHGRFVCLKFFNFMQEKMLEKLSYCILFINVQYIPKSFIISTFVYNVIYTKLIFIIKFHFPSCT